MERSTIFHGKTHELNGGYFHSYVSLPESIGWSFSAAQGYVGPGWPRKYFVAPCRGCEKTEAMQVIFPVILLAALKATAAVAQMRISMVRNENIGNFWTPKFQEKT